MAFSMYILLTILVFVVFYREIFRSRRISNWLFPELRHHHFDHYATRYRAVNQARASLSYLAYLAASFSLLNLIWLVTGRRPASSFTMLDGVIAILPIPTAILLCYMLFRPRIRKSIRRQIIDEGYAICIDCGYSLHGLTVSRCPECGCATKPVKGGLP